MCDAYIKTEYEKHNINNKLGLWDINGSFTGQFVIKPYDVNGYGDSTAEIEVIKTANGGIGNDTSKKTMPASALNIYNNSPINNQDQKYLPTSVRYGHTMCLFHNTAVTVSLVNTTTYNQNNPAEYKINWSMTYGGQTFNLESPTVFTSRKHHYADTSKVISQTTQGGATVQLWDDYHLQFLYSGHKIIGKEAGQPPFSFSSNEYNAGWTIKYTPNSNPTSGYDANSRVAGIVINDPSGNQPNPNDLLPVGMQLFNNLGESLGTVQAHLVKGGVISHHSIIMNALPVGSTAPTFTNNSKIYIPVEREPMYLQTTAHIAVAFEQSTKRMSIFYNGIEVASRTVPTSTTGNFSFHPSDVYMGQNPTLSYPNNRKTQYMGELNSIIFTNTYLNSFTSLFNTLAPFKDVMLYYDFSEGRD